MVDFFYLPNVRHIVRAKKDVSCSLTPTVETPFMVSHKIFSGENRMHLVPDDGLRELELASLEDRRIVGTVGVAAPNVEGATWLEYSGPTA
jgi:hypothetical protein